MNSMRILYQLILIKAVQAFCSWPFFCLWPYGSFPYVNAYPLHRHPNQHRYSKLGRSAISARGISDDPWCQTNSECCGQKQSPIALDSNAISDTQKKFNFVDYNVVPKNMTIENNGHSINVKINDEKLHPAISEGGLSGNYVFDSLHFHWGKNNKEGSEHTLYGFRYALELHMVHYHSSYKSLKEAVKSKDAKAVAVLGILYEDSMKENPAFKVITDYIKFIKMKGQTYSLPQPVNLASFLPQTTSKFFRYYGSLTTPPCTENVIWTVFVKTNFLSNTQFEALRSILHTVSKDYPFNQEKGNYRQLQRQLHSNKFFIVNTVK